MALYYHLQGYTMTVEAKPIRLSPTGKFIVVAIIIALTILLLHAVGHVMSPFVAAAITAYLFNPLIRWLQHRTHAGRAIWIVVLYVLVAMLLYGLFRFVGPIIGGQYRDLRHHIPEIVGTISREIAANQTITVGGLTLDMAPIEQPLLDFLSEFGRTVSSAVPHLVFTAIESVLLFVTYLIVTFYFLLQADQIMNWAYNLVPAPYRAEIKGLGVQIDKILSGYIRGTLLLIPIMATLTFTALTILGIRYALVLAIASGILEIIPLIGPWSATAIAVAVALFQSTTPFGWEHWLLALVIGTIYFVLRMCEDNFIIPNVVGHAVHLHPVLVIFGILAGGAIGGPFGLLVAIPVVAIIRLLLRYLYHKLIDSPVPPLDIAPPLAHPAAQNEAPAPPVASQDAPAPRGTQSLETPPS